MFLNKMMVVGSKKLLKRMRKSKSVRYIKRKKRVRFSNRIARRTYYTNDKLKVDKKKQYRAILKKVELNTKQSNIEYDLVDLIKKEGLEDKISTKCIQETFDTEYPFTLIDSIMDHVKNDEVLHKILHKYTDIIKCENEKLKIDLKHDIINKTDAIMMMGG